MLAHRRHRAAAGVRRQRPARRHAGLGRPHLPQPLRRAARPARRAVHQQRQRLRRRARPRRGPASTIAAIVDLRPTADGALPRRGGEAGLPDPAAVRPWSAPSGRLPDRAGLGRRRWRRRHAVDRPSRRRCDCDCLLMSGGWNPTVHLFSQSRGKLRFDDDAAAFVPEPVGAGRALRRRLQRQPCRWPACLAEGARGRCRGRRGCRLQRDRAGRARGRGAGSRRRCCRLGRAAAGCRRRAPRRSSISRTTSPPRTSGSRVARGLPARSSTSSATPRPAWAPTRARPATSTRWRSSPASAASPIAAVGTTTFRPPYTPVTFGALAGPHGGELFDPIRRTPSHAWATARGRGVRGCRQLEAARYFPRAGEDMHAAVAARVPRRARRGSACSTPARSARSTSRARTPPSSSTASTPTPGPSSRSAAAATA